MFAAIASIVTWFWGAYATYNKLPAILHGLVDFCLGFVIGWLWKALAIAVCVLALAGTASAEPPNGAAQQFAQFGDRGFEKDKPIDQRVLALEIKVELLQRQLGDIISALEELDKKLPPSLKESAKRKTGLPPIAPPVVQQKTGVGLSIEDRLSGVEQALAKLYDRVSRLEGPRPRKGGRDAYRQ